MKLLPRLKSLQARLLALLVGMVTLVWLGAAALIWIDASHELDELLDAHLAQSAALLIAQQTNTHSDAGDHSEHQKKEPVDDTLTLHKYATRVAFQVFHEGRLTLSSGNVSALPLSNETAGFSSVKMPDRSEWRVFGTRGNESDVQVFVGEQTESRDNILWAVLMGVLKPLLYALPALVIVGWLAVRRGLAPLRYLSQVLAQRQPQALEPIVLGDLPAEIKPVVHSLNALFDRIQVMVASERRFTADAAHELRTPIAAIRTQAQVALGAIHDSAQRDHALNYTLAGCDRATHLVEQLLVLSRLESSSAGAPNAAVDVSGVAQRVAADLALTALGRGQVLELDAPAPCVIQADDMLTSVLVRNLLDNAMRYSPDEAKVALSVNTEANQVVLRVDDSGPGLAEAEIAHLGERFYRVLGTSQTGSGLGWSIVRRIAAAYRAQIDVRRSEVLGGLSVTVRWSAQTHARP